jgi:hypothetical protein
MTVADFNKSAFAGLCSAKDVGNEVSFDGRIALPLAACSTGIPRGQDIEIKDEAGHLIAILCLTKDPTPVEIASLTDEQRCAFLTEFDGLKAGPDYVFKNDYVVVTEAKREDYRIRFQEGAPVWGGFVHAGPDVMPEQRTATITELTARPYLPWRTQSHQRAAARANREPYVFERFLKLYHMLELLFDHDFVLDIRSLNDDLHGIGKLMSSYKSDDVTRLKTVVKKYCMDHTKLLNHINKLTGHVPTAREIFYRYGKEGNPVNEDKFLEIMQAGGFSAGKWKGNHLPTVIQDFTVYAIYRVRSCVAHNKIGEYLISDTDDVFLLDFAEPLLREVLCQVFSAPPPPPPVITSP